MKKILFLLSFIVLGLEIQAQMNAIPYRKGEKWGYCDKNKKILLEPKYEAVTFFDSNHFAKVQKKTKWGVVDHTFKEVISPKYGAITHVTSKPRLFYVTHNHKQGIYDIVLQKEVVPVKYDKVELAAPQSNYIKITQYNKVGLCNTQHHIIIPVKFNDIREEGEFVAVQKKGKWGFYNKKGKIVIPISFDQGQYFKREKEFYMSQNGTLFTFDLNGKLIDAIEGQEIEVSIVSTNKEKKITKIDSNVTEQVYLKPHKKRGKWGYNKGGKNIIPHKYEVAYRFHKGLAKVKYKGVWGYINEKGEEYFED